MLKVKLKKTQGKQKKIEIQLASEERNGKIKGKRRPPNEGKDKQEIIEYLMKH